MSASIFSTSAHAKCILAGEHAVLYGCPALVIPVKKKTMNLTFNESYPLRDEVCGLSENSLQTSFLNTLKQALTDLNKKFPDEIGKGGFKLETNIEMGAGIGSSAALCVVIGRWLVWKGWLEENNLFDFLRHLENLYHDQSSGLDIIGAMYDTMVVFHLSTSANVRKVKACWHPRLYISYSGIEKNTKEAVARVHEVRRHHLAKAKQIDEQMKESVYEIEKALEQEEKLGKPLLMQGLKRAGCCFEEWNLMTPDLYSHIDFLYQLGALAAKPTGSGLGGYVVSLWEEEAPLEIKSELIEL